MQTRLSKMSWVLVCVGMFLAAGPAVPTQAGNWFRSKQADDADCDEECPDDAVQCPRRMRSCRWCQGRGCQWCQGNGGRWYQGNGGRIGLGSYRPVNGYY